MTDAIRTARPLRRDAERNRQRIIEAAREVFAVRGVAATLDDVARQAGVGIGTVYRRFPTKEALLEVALEEKLREHVRVAEAALEAPTGWDGLTMFLRAAVRMQADDRGLRDVALGAELSLTLYDRIRARVEPPITALVERARSEESLRPDITVHDVPLLLMMVTEIAHHSHQVRPDLHDRYLQLLIDGLRRSESAGDLGRPPSSGDVDAVAKAWLPSAAARR
ncbi:TetR family transcriptional regulator [Actinoplanes capillaceus]|uniref:TetR family transcriptional regulator n=1 Tax=Actinoplanes campanulatus TaxID=113559 RepID=A0ABQ3WQ95_9ACTN|nr:TetR/AcrR family transcriptional regulator [Actinoplanes capillaceus]GID48426.1 TetR family transcriptional regulator [Actinoplanes capillaceus]